MENKMKQIMENIKSQFGTTFDPPNQITPENLSILLFEMSKQLNEAFA